MLNIMTAKIIDILKDISEIETNPKRERWSNYILIGQKKGGKDAKTKDS